MTPEGNGKLPTVLEDENENRLTEVEGRTKEADGRGGNYSENNLREVNLVDLT